ncbi:hypothetical protein Fcan01_23925 [Folsomia candida]|uniref:Mariner Mos1 transposase n=1 Tax=Folsomia candida TaxID=158441 RepID=A0A226D965_FOLCA|nr:hypothetical protein Fcan01_23925 [Folsomia candida]
MLRPLACPHPLNELLAPNAPKPPSTRSIISSIKKMHLVKGPLPISGEKSKFAVTLDEAWFYLGNCNGKRKICYRKEGEKIPSNLVVPRLETLTDKFMEVGAMSGKGVLPLHQVPPKVKINLRYYIDKVLKPLLEIEIPKLYGNETHKVVVHHDQAPSHTSPRHGRLRSRLKKKTRNNNHTNQGDPRQVS